MILLLDTHAIIWFLEGDAQLSPVARKAIESITDTRVVSIASLWEIAIKVSLGKLTVTRSLFEVYETILTNGFVVLPIRFEHVLKVSQLLFYYRDPFDRY